MKIYNLPLISKLTLCMGLMYTTHYTQAQLGFVTGPYVILPSFGSTLYGQDNNKLYNGTLGMVVHLDLAKSISFNFINYRTLEEKKGTPNQITWLKGTQYVPLRYAEYNTTITLLNNSHSRKLGWENNVDNVNDGSVSRTLGIRMGAIISQRMVQLTPNKFHWVDNNFGNPKNVYDYYHEFVITHLNQTLVFAGIKLNNYKNKIRVSGPFTFFSYKLQGWVNSSHGNMDLPPRRRKWEQYFDIMYAAKQTYGNYVEQGVSTSDSVSVQSSDIPNLQNIGWRFGIRRVTFNNLGHSFIMEFGQYPGQKRDLTESEGEPIDSIWKNCFVFIGFNITKGHWFGGY